MIDTDKVATILHHGTHLHKANLEAHGTRPASRKHWYEKHRRDNYIKEYERIRGELSRSV